MWRSGWVVFIAPSRSTARLDHLPAVSGWIAEAGVYGAIAVDRFLCELHTFASHQFVGRATVAHGQHQRRHRALGHDRSHGLCGGLIYGRRARHEQPKLKRRLFRVLNREPSIVPVRTSVWTRNPTLS